MNWRAVFVGATADAGFACFAAAVALPEAARWPAFAGVLAGGLVGGYLAGRRAGSWRDRVRHGALAGLLGGGALAVAVWWSLQPGTPDGALWSANYLLATGARWLPPGAAARYDALLGVATALACGTVYVVEGALAAGAAPGGESEIPLARD
ncbi:hypothetical protein M0R88_08290 [Halorussus gelatinilyticus]|uniref:Uncharacterized protein n=1 Tax=Halorussus gelatinilyticus TaxID=2937524 RepID=A0A8U0INA3_9EURY|nr:hypothetical protein [Halorussus gelatinilyticus]UPW02081.1 hypothetical protein M0R88_08290 [Halorussus gelatinilyticus]